MSLRDGSSAVLRDSDVVLSERSLSIRVTKVKEYGASAMSSSLKMQQVRALTRQQFSSRCASYLTEKVSNERLVDFDCPTFDVVKHGHHVAHTHEKHQHIHNRPPEIQLPTNQLSEK